MLTISLIIFSSFCTVAQAVSSVSISTPGSLEAGQDLTLDCDFEFEGAEATQLDLKWYFNGSPVPIYQWVPALDLGPQVIDPMFKDNLDLKYEAHGDNMKKHKALHIINPDQRFSGNYKCRVSSFVDEASAENEVIVYVPPSQVLITPLQKESAELQNITCEVLGIFPQPLVSLVWTENNTMLSSDDMAVTHNKANTGLFDVSIAAIIDEYDVTKEDMITCEITIPGTDFNILIETKMFEETEKEDPDLELEIFSGSASGSEDDDLCESSGDDECGHPSDYEIVDENFDKISVESGLQEEVDPKDYGRGHQISGNKIGLVIVLISVKIHLI